MGEVAKGDSWSLLDMTFDSSALDVVRSEVLAFSIRAGLADDQAADVVLAVHELAANVVRHGGGKGRLRVWGRAEELHCQVDDGDLIVTAEPAAGLAPLPEHPGHGLWVARQVTSQMQALSGPGGTRVTLTFERPAAQ